MREQKGGKRIGVEQLSFRERRFGVADRAKIELQVGMLLGRIAAHKPAALVDAE